MNRPLPILVTAAVFAACSATTATLAAEEIAAPEWFGSEAGWTQWSRATGDWAGARTWLEERGVAFAGNYTFDWSAPLSGGLSQRGAARGLLDLVLVIDTEPLVGLPGGSFATQFLHHHGRNGSDDVGDLQAYSNIDGDPFSKLYELWYQQELFDGKLRVKAGQVDANSEFAINDTGGDLLNSSAGFTPTILGFPTYPDPRLSVNVFVQPADLLYVGGGVYGSRIEDSFDFDHPFWIGEAGIRWDQHGGGRFAGGVWHDSATIDRFDGSTQEGTTGFYFVAEQRLWTENPDVEQDTQGIAGFLQYGQANGAVSTFTHHIGCGIRWEGPVAGRDADILSLGGNWTRQSNDPAAGFTGDEWNLEATYAAQLTPFFRLVPDVQWIGNPGGDATRDSVFVATLRASVDF